MLALGFRLWGLQVRSTPPEPKVLKPSTPSSLKVFTISGLGFRALGLGFRV